MSYNPEKDIYLNPNIEFLFDNNIIEYDMKDAGITLIQEYRLLDSRTINELLNLDKTQRYISIGKIQRDDKEFSKVLLSKFAEARALFASANKLTDNNIISVRKDAIYTFGKCNKTKFGKIEFLPKNIYSSYIRFVENMNIEIYYNSINLDIKGMGDIAINKHRLYMLGFIQKSIQNLESKNLSYRRILINFISAYKNNKLDEEYYVEFNNISKDINPIYNFKKVLIPLLIITLREI